MSKMLSSTELSEMICTRISHDLIGNIGAISNAVELLDEDADSLTEIKPILDLSAHTLTARLKFFRLTFGLDNACPRTIADLEKTAAEYLSTIGGRQTPIILKLNLSTPRLYKIVLPAVMALSDVFIRGGELSVDEQKDGLMLTATSTSPLSTAKLDTYQAVLKGSLPEENPSQTAPLLYLKEILSEKDVRIDLTFEINRAVLSLHA
jgi:histidine phosphotransferase ChpT